MKLATMKKPEIDSCARTSHRQGFTLIEMLVTVAILGILVALAVPAYHKYVQRGIRVGAQSQMMDLSNREQQYLLANRSYLANSNATTVGTMYSLPADIVPYYTLTVAPDRTLNSCAVTASTTPSFVITFTAIGRQAADGSLMLSSDGAKCPAGKW
jgi:type IV pilus assembly protein PilE